MEKITVESILSTLKDWVENKHPVSVEMWLDAAMKLNILAEDIDNEIAIMEAEMADKEANLVEKDIPVSKANILKRKAINYLEYKKKQALRERITEHIRIAKQRQRLPNL